MASTLQSLLLIVDMLDLHLISIGLGLFIGLVLALTGAGGSILAIPLLVFSLNLNVNQAAPIALLAVMAASSLGAVQGLRIGIVRYKAAMLIAGFGMALAPFGVWLAQRTPNHILSYLFILILFYIAWHMWQQNSQNLDIDIKKPDAPCVINPATSKLFWTAYCTKKLAITGFVAGLLSGLLGVGGGFVIVPSLRKVSNFDMQTTIATSLAIVALVSASSVTSYLLQGSIHWKIATPFVISTMLGLFIFRLMSHKIPTIVSQRSFAVLAIIAAILMLIKKNF